MATATKTPFATVEDAIEDIRAGRFVVVVDDPDRENEGDLVIAAQFATPDAINFMATHARGLICLSLTEERCNELGLRPMTEHNEARLGTAFTVSIEAREGVTTGISAHDRSRAEIPVDRKSTRLNSSHLVISYAVFCLKKKKQKYKQHSPTRQQKYDTGFEDDHVCQDSRSRCKPHVGSTHHGLQQVLPCVR